MVLALWYTPHPHSYTFHFVGILMLRFPLLLMLMLLAFVVHSRSIFSFPGKFCHLHTWCSGKVVYPPWNTVLCILWMCQCMNSFACTYSWGICSNRRLGFERNSHCRHLQRILHSVGSLASASWCPRGACPHRLLFRRRTQYILDWMCNSSFAKEALVLHLPERRDQEQWWSWERACCCWEW